MARKVEKQKMEYNGMMKQFHHYAKKYNEKYYAADDKKRTAQRYARIRNRRASDCAIGYHPIFPARYEPKKILQKNKRFALDGIGKLGYIPPFKVKFHHSVPVHCERYNLKTPDEIDYHQKFFRQAV